MSASGGSTTGADRMKAGQALHSPWGFGCGLGRIRSLFDPNGWKGERTPCPVWYE